MLLYFDNPTITGYKVQFFFPQAGCPAPHIISSVIYLAVFFCYTVEP